MKLTIHPAAFMFGALLLCATWLSLRTVPAPTPFTSASHATVPRAARVERKEIGVDPATLQRYAGEYRFDAGTVVVELASGRLFATAPSTPRLELFAFSSTEFFLKDIEAEVTFDASADGPASGFVVRLPSGTLTAKRVR